MLRFVQRPGERSWFERPEGMSPVLHQLLMQRGIASAEEADAFLHPDVHQLMDPFLLSDMSLAAERIHRAMDGDERICIWGDYDVDGVCASAILYDYFSEAGVAVEVYLPSRHNEGYGLNETGLREIAERNDLLITVDCGISNHDQIELAKELGLDCIVTDHHRPGTLLPECPVVNPHLNAYPAPLCGAGVAFKLVHALSGLEAALERIDLAAIATVADVVSLRGENRAIVHLGLERINAQPRAGVAALMESARVEMGSVKSETIAFRLAPRLNAGGRLGSARRSFELLVQQDRFLSIAQADELEQENARRQSIEREIRAEAEKQLAHSDFSAHRILLAWGEGWNAGVIGLTASHLKEAYHYPVIVLSQTGDELVGSCRSIEGVDIYAALCSVADLLVRFGGHSQAAGLTIKAENLDALWQRLDAYLQENIDPLVWTPTAEYDIHASLDEFSEAFVCAMGALEPTGCGNPEPVFCTSVQMIESRAIGAQGAHLRLICAENGVRRTGIYFGAGALAGKMGETAEILFTPQINTWNGRSEVQLRLCALREYDLSARLDDLISEEGALQRKFLTELFYNRGYTPADAPLRTMSELKALLTGSIQGTWIICAGIQAARQTMQALDPCLLDLAIGHLPEDERCFNSIVVCPEPFSDFPTGLRRLVFVGMPAMQPPAQDVEVLELDTEPAFRGKLPDVDEMREIYKAARRLAKRPMHAGNMENLVQLLAGEAGLDASKSHVSLLALMDMKLLALNPKPFGLTIPPMQKTDPNSSPVWRRIQIWKERSEGRSLDERQ